MLYNFLKQIDIPISIEFDPDENYIIIKAYEGDVEIIITQKGEVYAEKLEGYFTSKDLNKILQLMELFEKK